MSEKIETYIRPVSINIAWNIEPYFKKFRRRYANILMVYVQAYSIAKYVLV